jgi:PAS domain S-box-containing protein
MGKPDTESTRNRSIHTKEPDASREGVLSSRETAISSRETAGRAREDAVALREEAVRAREEAAQARLELDALMGQVREANEHLVVANLRSQTLAEKAEHAYQRLSLQYAVTTILAESPSLSDVYSRILQAIAEGAGWEFGALWQVERETHELRCKEVWQSAGARVPEFTTSCQQFTFAPGIGLPGRVWSSGEPAWIPDVTLDSNLRASIAAKEGLHTGFAFPVRLAGVVLGVIEFLSPDIRQPDNELLQMMNAIGSQLGQFIQRKVMEEALAEQVARKSAMLDSSLDAVVTMNHEGRIVDFNQVAERIFGYTAEQVAGRTVADTLIPEGLRQQHRQGLARFQQTGEGPVLGRRIELAAIRADGSEFPVELTISTGRLPGRPAFFTAYIRDLTERKRAEDTSRRLAAIVESSDDAIIGKTLDGIITSWNKGAERIYGYTAEEIVGSPISVLVPRDHLDELPAILDRLKLGQNIERVETVRMRKDAARIDVALTISSIKDDSGRTIAASTIARDVTERKQAEEERARLLDRERDARAEAETANRLKDEFLAMVSHELRTPLNAVMGWARMLGSKQLPSDRAAHAIATIERNAVALAHLIDDLLDVSRFVAGTLRLAAQPVDLAAVVQAALDAVRPLAATKNVQLAFSPDLEALEPVSGDAGRLQQVIWNLLANAIKFTPEGGRVAVFVEPSKDHMEIRVVDTGEGISPDFLPHVFERFRQADDATTQRHTGLGLGLAIVRQLVELHGGTVHVASDGVGCGATFTVRLPISAGEARGGQAAALGEQRTAASAASPMRRLPRLDELRILVVDDSSDGRTLTSLVLTQAGASVKAVASVREALQAFAVECPDALVSDIGLSDADGYALIRQIRQYEAEHGGFLPAVALTGYARAEDRARILAAGFQAHVPKPVEPVELTAAIATITQHRREHF